MLGFICAKSLVERNKMTISEEKNEKGEELRAFNAISRKHEGH